MQAFGRSAIALRQSLSWVAFRRPCALYYPVLRSPFSSGTTGQTEERTTAMLLEKFRKARRQTWFMVAMLVFFAGLWIYGPLHAQPAMTAAPAAAAPAAREFHWFAPLDERHVQHRRARRAALRARGGLPGAGLRGVPGQAGQVGRRGHGPDAGDRRGGARGLARVSLGAVPEDRAAHRGDHDRALPDEDGGAEVRLRARGRVLHRRALQLDGRLRRHAHGDHGQPARGRRGPAQLRRGACSSATAPARSPAC